MSNTIKIKRGATAPTVDNLDEYELGYSTNEKNLYINDNDEIIRLSSNVRVLPFPAGFPLRDFKINEGYEKENFPYYYDITISGVKATEIPIIIFKPITPMDVAYFCEAKDGIINIYASDKTDDSTKMVEIQYIILINTK